MKITILEALEKFKAVHDEIKNHPYWKTYDYSVFKKEIYPKYRELLELYSCLRYNDEYEDRDSPFFAIVNTIYHDFSAMLGILVYSSKHNGVEMKDTNDFKEFYVPVLQNFLQLVHFFIEGKNSENTMIMYMPKDVYTPQKPMVKFVPVYHESWTMDDGYNAWYSGGYKWRAICEVKKERKEKLIEAYRKLVDKYRKMGKQSFVECYEHYIKDLEEETNLIIKMV